MKRLLLLAALPLPIFSAAPGLPVPVWTNATVIVESRPVHTGTPLTKPTKLNHTYRHWGRCDCTMCLGSHLNQMHGYSNAELDKLGYQNWQRYHDRVHPKPKHLGKGRCAGGFCPTPRRPVLLRDFLSRLR